MKRKKKQTEYKGDFKEVNDSEIEWLICPHCRHKVYGKSQKQVIVSWTADQTSNWKK